jgi:hypothetical protein
MAVTRRQEARVVLGGAPLRANDCACFIDDLAIPLRADIAIVADLAA